MRRKFVIPQVAAAVLLATGLPTESAAASPTSNAGVRQDVQVGDSLSDAEVDAIGKADPAEVAANQALMESSVERLQSLPQDGGNGLSSLVYHVLSKTVDVYWAGPTTHALLETVKAASNRGVTLRVLPAPFNSTDLSAAYDRVRLDQQAAPSSAQLADKSSTVRYVAIATDGSGLIVGLDESGSINQRSGFMSPGTLAISSLALTDRIAAVTAVPVTYVAVHGTGSQFATRSNDATPFKGGAIIRNAGGGTCSTGFTVKENATGKIRMLTAQHCNNGTFKVPSGATVGVGLSVADATLAIGPPSLASGPYQGRVYDGTWNNSAG